MADTLASIAAAVTSARGTAPTTTSGVAFSAAGDKTTLANNFNSFLTLLTTQLRNQTRSTRSIPTSSPSSWCSSRASSSRST